MSDDLKLRLGVIGLILTLLVQSASLAWLVRGVLSATELNRVGIQYLTEGLRELKQDVKEIRRDVDGGNSKSRRG